MAFTFMGSQKPTLGVEVELQLLDPKTLDLAPHAEFILEKCQSLGLPRIKAEIHQSMLEVDTEISDTVKECREFLKTRFQDLHALAKNLNLKLGISGTHPFQRWKHGLISNTERYQNLYQKYQWLVRRMNVYGLHVHVGVESGDHALKVTKSLIRYLPHLLALSANSPFWQGVDTGMQSTRINIMESFPLAGVPKPFDHWHEFEHYCTTLQTAGAIQSVKDLYWFIRPNLTFGTIEFRICDAMPNLNDTMALVAFIQSLVVFSQQHSEHPHWKWTREHQWIMPENQWIAARDGLEGIITTDLNGKKQKISESILQLVEWLTPTARDLDCEEELLHIKKMIAQGNGAERQRAVYQKNKSFTDIIAASIDEFESSLSTLSGQEVMDERMSAVV